MAQITKKKLKTKTLSVIFPRLQISIELNDRGLDRIMKSLRKGKASTLTYGLLRADITFDESLLVEGAYDVKSGVECAQKLLLLRERPTALFCFNDDMAIGAMQFLQQQGFNIPEDISVMGFDDINYAEYVSPSLTTIHQPLQEIGSTCIELLLKQLKGEKVQTGSQYLPFKLMIRNSTGRAPNIN